MKRRLLMLSVSLVAGIVLGMIGYQVLNAQQQAVKRTVLLKTDLEGIEGRDGNVVIVEIAPGAESGKHYHPGHEIAYIQEGSATIEIEGKKPVTYKRGAVAHLTPKQAHNVKNNSKTAPVKALVFAIYEKGQPEVTPVK